MCPSLALGLGCLLKIKKAETTLALRTPEWLTLDQCGFYSLRFLKIGFVANAIGGFGSSPIHKSMPLALNCILHDKGL